MQTTEFTGKMVDGLGQLGKALTFIFKNLNGMVIVSIRAACTAIRISF